ncbi:STY4851/ECs_5259 family protein [Azotobacter beijerinckii]|uniref:STY4851/ECs_5259 family protein n=1 Tax=Azotobacter beijerinckii TaxID=170623 RepID=UPI002953976E|nr:STY4851/ECs_5259 family protein [Azotobacter beijerinckii]MDV7211465.1 STY4851/ECs_5259 family protein [Azotobacter beijerinckii]
MSLSVFKCSSWLTAFLQRRGMQAPDQRGLYEYHCSYEEYRDLQCLLRELGSFEAGVKDAAACACLTLFCSEWYRREYQRDHGWSWEPIFQALGFSLSPGDLSRAIPKGLEGFWKRPIHFYESERRDFLGSLFSEGGLPFQVLREGGSRFQTLFDRVLRQYGQGQLLGFSTFQQVEQQLEKASLPQVFASRTSVELIARMADQLVALVRDYALTQADEPVARLDAMNPKWRELFPLPLDNETGSELLNGLLKTATAESKKRRNESGGWTCRHFWHEAQPEALKVQVSMPAEVVFRLAMQPSTTRFELAIVEDGQTIVELGPGYAVLDNGAARIRLRQREVMGQRRDCSAPLSLVAMAGGMLIASLPIEGSAVALGEVPVGFEPVNDRWQLCGQASFNTGSEEVLLVLPADSVLSMVGQDDDASITDMPPVCSVRTVKVQSKVQLQVEGEEQYRICTGHSAGMGLGLELAGTQTDWATKPALTFVGLPRVHWLAASGELQQQGGDLYVAGKQPGSGMLQEMLGAQYVSVRNRNGDTLLRRKVGILPADFRAQLRSGDKPGQGSILVHTRQSCLLQVDDDSLQVQRVKQADHTELKLSANGFPPVRVRLSVTPSLLADPVEIELPFPNSGCLAFDCSGKQLKRDLCIDDLLGARLFLFGRASAPTRFGLEMTLKGNTARNACYSWSYTASDKPLEISLFNIREQIIDLLSLQSGIDQVVELRVSGNGQDAYYRIRKYSTEMLLDRDRQVLCAANLHDSNAALPEPALMLLHEPMRSAIALSSRTSEGVPTGEFELPALVEKDGPWLVLPKSGASVSFRPLFIAGGWEPVPQSEEAQSLQKAVLTFDHTSPVSSFTPVLNAMAINPQHSGWQFLRALYEGYGYLPLATFEVWKALVGHPRALAMALFKFEMEAKFLGRLEAEFPLFWEFLPIVEIHLAAKRFNDFLKVKGVAEEAVDALIGRMLSRLEETCPAYGESVQRFLSGKSVGPEIQLPLTAFKSVLRGWYVELIRDRSDAKWPEFGGKRLERWHSSQTDSVISFRPEMDYRNAVVYLPVFAAAVASGKAQFSDVFEDGVEAIFFLRQVRDFDSKWFNSIYQYCLLNSVMDMHKAEPVNG